MNTMILDAPAAGRRTRWQIDAAHSVVAFDVKHMMISRVRGQFGDVRGTLQLDAADETRSHVEVEIDVASIDTRQPQRDEHLRSADFFDVAQFPTMTFRSTAVERTPEGFRVVGRLTIRGVTREVALSVAEEGSATDPQGVERRAYSATTVIDRREFGLTWNQALEAGGVLVGNEIRISLEVQATGID